MQLVSCKLSTIIFDRLFALCGFKGYLKMLLFTLVTTM